MNQKPTSNINKMKEKIIEMAFEKTIINISNKIWNKSKEEFPITQVIYPALYLISVPSPKISVIHEKAVLEHEHYIIPRGMVKGVDLTEFFCGNYSKEEIAMKMKMSANMTTNLLAFIFISEAFGVEQKFDSKKDLIESIGRGEFIPPSQRDDRRDIITMQVQTENFNMSYDIEIISDFTNMKKTVEGLVPEKSLGKEHIEKVESNFEIGTFAKIYPKNGQYQEIIKQYISCQ